MSKYNEIKEKHPEIAKLLDDIIHDWWNLRLGLNYDFGTDKLELGKNYWNRKEPIITKLIKELSEELYGKDE